jgi:hypothetical protein
MTAPIRIDYSYRFMNSGGAELRGHCRAVQRHAVPEKMSVIVTIQERTYSKVSIMNRDFAVRLSNAAKKGANINALVNLDCFAAMMPLAAEDTLQAIKPYFSAYL